MTDCISPEGEILDNESESGNESFTYMFDNQFTPLNYDGGYDYISENSSDQNEGQKYEENTKSPQTMHWMPTDIESVG